MLSCDIDWILSCDIDWMLHFINGWKNEWMLDVNGECRVMLGGGGWGQMSFHLYVVGPV